MGHTTFPLRDYEADLVMARNVRRTEGQTIYFALPDMTHFQPITRIERGPFFDGITFADGTDEYRMSGQQSVWIMRTPATRRSL